MVVEKRIIGRALHPDLTRDVAVYTLDSPLPASITPCKVLPAPAAYANYLSYVRGGRPPVMALDQDENALVKEVRALDGRLGDYYLPGFTLFSQPGSHHPRRLDFYEDWIPNDSGNPAFFIINDTLVLLASATQGGPGTGGFVSSLPYPTLNDLIAAADANATAREPNLLPQPTGLQVQTVDLSGFSTFTPP